MLKITRTTNAGTTTLIVSGRIEAEQLPDLRRLVEADQASDVVLDLNENCSDHRSGARLWGGVYVAGKSS
jgi:hypothetical protein